MRGIILVRGLPGSGKSTTAYKLMNWLEGSRVNLEADDFFVVSGKYQYDSKKSAWAHKYCQAKTAYHLNRDSLVIVANTFITMQEMLPYFIIAKEFEVPVRILECKESFGSIHNVPDETIERMKRNWQEFCPACSQGFDNITLMPSIESIVDAKEINIR